MTAYPRDPEAQFKLKQQDPFNRLTPNDMYFLQDALGGYLRPADLNIAPDGSPYLYRWHVVPRNRRGNTYIHVQVASDPERPLHDHPWDNTSVILTGGYEELLQPMLTTGRKPKGEPYMKVRTVGDVVHRKADMPHRLILPEGIPYTMTLFSTGPNIRPWGFWVPEETGLVWYDHKDVTETLADGRSVWTGPRPATT